jgi:uncharacterized protein (TIGR02266 family)
MRHLLAQRGAQHQFLEHRRHHRVAVDVEVTLESDTNFYTGITGDISEGGLFIATHAPPPPGAEVQFSLHLPGANEAWAVRGVVRWVREAEACGWGVSPGCGVQFTDVPAAALDAIAEFVRRRETIYFDV